MSRLRQNAHAVIATLIVALCSWGCSNEKARAAGKIAADREEKEKLLQNLSAKDLALREWDTNFTNWLQTAFTIDVQEKLLHRPIEFTARLADIYEQDGKIIAHFEPEADDIGFSLELHLTCTKAQREMLTAPWMLFGVVANLDKIVRPSRLIAVGEPWEARFAINDDTSTYWAFGSCLDFVKLESNYNVAP